MTFQSSLKLSLGSYTIPSPADQPFPYVVTVLLFILLLYTTGDHSSKLPELNPLKPLEFTNLRRMNEFIQQSQELAVRGKAIFGTNPYKLYSEWGSVVVLPPDAIHELRSHPHLNFLEAASDDAHGYLPGFDPFSGNGEMTKVVNKYLTKDLAKHTKPLSEEATLVLHEILGGSTAAHFSTITEWHQITPKDDIIQIVSRLSARVFMGEELCRDDEWVRVSANYASAAFSVGGELGHWPRWTRRIVHWFLPSCWKVRHLLATCRKVLKPHLERRHTCKVTALAHGDTKPVFNDSIEWFEQEETKKRDATTRQIALSLVAIHTTSDLLQQTMIDLAYHPELFEPLREEILRVLNAEGLTKTALYSMKLMDSVIKESQRMKPHTLSTWRRLATQDVRLTNGFVIRKGQKTIVANIHMWDTTYYDDPTQFDGYRFLRMRSTDEEKMSQLVSTSVKHPGFGHGQHACPGRFFAANEVKIALVHLLLKYDWKLPDNAKPQTVTFGMAMLPDPSAKFLIRRRKEELDLDSLAY
ncbi:cytochrome P450 [Colletotrichum tofieldiae]|uniref:Cytochrome P450 n=1 Tax=Colletotrichum tofieldiae TaxID=708197 RepID=A0A166V698_9PEZI|nr:cytochrome P450 [Colletotrichum tofieldiae]